MKTSSGAMFAGVEFRAPGPGSWELETSHLARPMSTFVEPVTFRALQRGMDEGAERYGLKMPMRMAVVNRFTYVQRVTPSWPAWLGGTPPRSLMWLVTRLHPALREDAARCAQAFDSRLWRADLERWDQIDRPRCMALHRALIAEDIEALDTEGLCAHLARAEAHLAEMVVIHHRYNMACILPVGEYVASVQEWTGASSGEVMEILRGSTPIAKGVAAAELGVLAAALRESGEGRAALVKRGDARAVLDALQAMAGPIGDATRAYLDVVRFRSLGYDVTDRMFGELPEMLVGAIRAVVDGDTRETRLEGLAEKREALRARVPFGLRGQFDALLEEARLVNRLRDERGLFADSMGTGLARRALLEAGRRLVAAGKLENAEQAAELKLPEVQGLLRGRSAPSIEEIQRRWTWRTTTRIEDAPRWLNAPPGPTPPIDVLPAPLRRGARAMSVIQTEMLTEPEVAERAETEPARVVSGLAINTGVYEGTARVVLDAADFDRIQRGDVLVTRSTSAYFNVVLPLLGALVTDRGGQLSHAAIVAREYGIPGIVGTKEATAVIPDGALVRVDGTTGEVSLLSERSQVQP
ncbi:PEP-utilizing enzyme [Chondromyces apiculatus]|uniref:PEP-utilising enzyme mobile domain-containing protein n=1 Tax=Chondromyces apiculatus DSM 436 TaxID=1192034 RepID=A0A017THD6_9BACT|nr:PEP-utilizing enzyme [Chondromyces apiculatus]EYF08683.1 Hypothetical protein CAP_2544 [Chondromyces apiculatus DSM 436]